MTKLVVCDIDGVLADISHRLPYLEEKNYEAFYGMANMIQDEPLYSGISLFRKLTYAIPGYEIILMTGRPERTRKITEMWLRYHDISFGKLYMRKDGDYRPSPEVKVELMHKAVENATAHDMSYGGYFIDDDPENVKAVEKAFPYITGIVFTTKRI